MISTFVVVVVVVVDRSRRTKIDTEVAHVTRDSDTTFKVNSQLAGGGGILNVVPVSVRLQ